ncbi:MAG: serine acetyltransferase [Acidimicrobiia bacterium]
MAETIDDQGAAWRADLARYPDRPFVREQSIWAIAVYRFGRWNDQRSPGVSRALLDRAYWAAFRIVETLTGVSFSKHTRIGPGLRVHHFGNVFVNEQSRIGANCTIHHGVTIGSAHEDGPAPIIGDGVTLGAYAQVLGGVRVGDGARIGAMTVVLHDVPAGSTAVGVPARIVPTGSARVGDAAST